MIRFDRVPEPASFHDEVRLKGFKWQIDHPTAQQYPNYWLKFSQDLADGFHNLCGYLAIWIQFGTVDHYLSQKNNRDKVYEWDNYRYASPIANSRKKPCHDNRLLDPYEVEDGWFEIHLPSLQVILTAKIPEQYKIRANTTLKTIIKNDPNYVRLQAQWLTLYEEGTIDLVGLRKFSPLLARALEKSQMSLP